MNFTIIGTIDIATATEAELDGLTKDELIQILLQLRAPNTATEETKKKSNNDQVYGYKNKNSTSKYNYVSWNRDKSQWTVQVAGEIVGYFDDEIVASMEADKYLDKIEDTNRPRNRRFFEDAKVL